MKKYTVTNDKAVESKLHEQTAKEIADSFEPVFDHTKEQFAEAIGFESEEEFKELLDKLQEEVVPISSTKLGRVLKMLGLVNKVNSNPLMSLMLATREKGERIMSFVITVCSTLDDEVKASELFEVLWNDEVKYWKEFEKLIEDAKKHIASKCSCESCHG